MKATGTFTGFAVMMLSIISPALGADQTRIPYLEARSLSHVQTPQRADAQRQLVLLLAQARLTPSWPLVYREIADVSLKIGRGDFADRALRKYHTLQTNSVMAQLELINLELQGLANTEGRRQYLENKLQQTDLLPEVISDIYRQLAQISWQNYETERARKYLDLAIRRLPQNLVAWESLYRIVRSDKNATPIQELEVRTGQTAARLMTNPFDASAALAMAILSGKVRDAERMRFWLDYAHHLKPIDKDLAAWPVDLRLEAAESFLAIEEPQRAATILTSILSSRSSTQPTTATADGIDDYTILHARILRVAAARQLNDPTTLHTQHDLLTRDAHELQTRSDAPANESILTAIYLTLYTDRPDYLQAITLAKRAMEKSPDDPLASIALALPLAISGETHQASQLLDKAREPNHPLTLLARAFIESNHKNTDKAKEFLNRGAQNTPYGPLREVLITTARRLNLPEPPEPDIKGIRQILNKFGTRYLALTTGNRSIGDLSLKTRGNLSRGQIVDLNLAFTNRTPVPLAVGPGSLISPYIVLEFRPAGSPADGKRFVHYLPIETRQILEPGKTIEAAEVLNAIRGWEEFITHRNPAIRQVTVQASLVATVPFNPTTVVKLAQSPAVTLDLPTLDRKNAEEWIEQLKTPVLNNPWQAAQLVYWLTQTPKLQNQKSALIDGMLRQLDSKSPESTRSAFLWALRAAKSDPRVINALASQLKAKKWFIRFMALDTLGRLQGKDANKLFEFYAGNDCDELVRQLSAGYLLKR
jgi:tetratricopeptide (TPR) repeat protein